MQNGFQSLEEKAVRLTVGTARSWDKMTNLGDEWKDSSIYIETS
jgi:hypothetical protein